MSVVVDASLVVALLVPDERQDAARDHLRRWLDGAAALHAPAVLSYEVANVLARLVFDCALGLDELRDIWDDLAALGIVLILSNSPATDLKSPRSPLVFAIETRPARAISAWPAGLERRCGRSMRRWPATPPTWGYLCSMSLESTPGCRSVAHIKPRSSSGDIPETCSTKSASSNATSLRPESLKSTSWTRLPSHWRLARLLSA